MPDATPAALAFAYAALEKAKAAADKLAAWVSPPKPAAFVPSSPLGIGYVEMADLANVHPDTDFLAAVGFDYGAEQSALATFHFSAPNAAPKTLAQMEAQMADSFYKEIIEQMALSSALGPLVGGMFDANLGYVEKALEMPAFTVVTEANFPNFPTYNLNGTPWTGTNPESFVETWVKKQPLADPSKTQWLDTPTEIAFQEAQRAFGFTREEAKAFIFANDSGVPFDTIAALLERIPTPRTADEKVPGRAAESKLLYGKLVALGHAARDREPYRYAGIIQGVEK